MLNTLFKNMLTIFRMPSLTDIFVSRLFLIVLHSILKESVCIRGFRCILLHLVPSTDPSRVRKLLLSQRLELGSTHKNVMCDSTPS